MEKVASHINEMQKIYEDYGAVFDQLVAEQAGQDKEVDSHLANRILITEHSKHQVADREPRFTGRLPQHAYSYLKCLHSS